MTLHEAIALAERMNPREKMTRSGWVRNKSAYVLTTESGMCVRVEDGRADLVNMAAVVDEVESMVEFGPRPVHGVAEARVLL